MEFKVKYEKEAQKKLKKMDRFQASLIIKWIEKNLIGCENPYTLGKGLTGDKSGYWRYRVGDYRIVAEIKEGIVTILILQVGHRKEIYK